jgi:hypothetical protein
MKRSMIAIVLMAFVFAAMPRLASLAAPTSNAAPPPGAVVVPIAAQSGSNQTGTATLTASGDKTQVVIALNGMPAGSQEPAHIHQGTCAKLNPKPAYPLSTVADGQSATTVNVPLATLQTGGFAINVHQSTTNLGTYVACGNIPAATGTSSGSMPAATPAPIDSMSPR